ncbi:hypothetical protein PACTADRAFT_33949 [Pachysolen tannophilus NRRL Y-2460]|uniref:Uncharacterized protein n=1 Tax=Pachysolen tannophilus NRRL Y-2460 TaxID=669874 RepID=A0A1E4TUF5_PACTA|nr:hypothetical protein PACTADRAFT_33949 [Pachysolen tannophilus NRRL Y-2460]
MPAKKKVKDSFYLNYRISTFENGATVGRSKKLVHWLYSTNLKKDMLSRLGFFFTPTQQHKDQITCCNCLKKEYDLSKLTETEVAIRHLKQSPNCESIKLLLFLITNKDPSSMLLDPFSEQSINLRMHSFQNWPHKKPEPKSLCEAGFIYQPTVKDDDTTVCLYCGCSLEGWQEGDDPMEEHKIRSGNCSIVNVKVVDSEGSDESDLSISFQDDHAHQQHEDISDQDYEESSQKKVSTAKHSSFFSNRSKTYGSSKILKNKLMTSSQNSSFNFIAESTVNHKNTQKEAERSIDNVAHIKKEQIEKDNTKYNQEEEEEDVFEFKDDDDEEQQPISRSVSLLKNNNLSVPSSKKSKKINSDNSQSLVSGKVSGKTREMKSAENTKRKNNDMVASDDKDNTDTIPENKRKRKSPQPSSATHQIQETIESKDTLEYNKEASNISGAYIEVQKPKEQTSDYKKNTSSEAENHVSIGKVHHSSSPSIEEINELNVETKLDKSDEKFNNSNSISQKKSQKRKSSKLNNKLEAGRKKLKSKKNETTVTTEVALPTKRDSPKAVNADFLTSEKEFEELSSRVDKELQDIENGIFSSPVKSLKAKSEMQEHRVSSSDSMLIQETTGLSKRNSILRPRSLSKRNSSSGALIDIDMNSRSGDNYNDSMTTKHKLAKRRKSAISDKENEISVLATTASSTNAQKPVKESSQDVAQKNGPTDHSQTNLIETKVEQKVRKQKNNASKSPIKSQKIDEPSAKTKTSTKKLKKTEVKEKAKSRSSSPIKLNKLIDEADNNNGVDHDIFSDIIRSPIRKKTKFALFDDLQDLNIAGDSIPRLTKETEKDQTNTKNSDLSPSKVEKEESTTVFNADQFSEEETVHAIRKKKNNAVLSSDGEDMHFSPEDASDADVNPKIENKQSSGLSEEKNLKQITITTSPLTTLKDTDEANDKTVQKVSHLSPPLSQEQFVADTEDEGQVLSDKITEDEGQVLSDKITDDKVINPEDSNSPDHLTEGHWDDPVEEIVPITELILNSKGNALKQEDMSGNKMGESSTDKAKYADVITDEGVIDDDDDVPAIEKSLKSPTAGKTSDTFEASNDRNDEAANDEENFQRKEQKDHIELNNATHATHNLVDISKSLISTTPKSRFNSSKASPHNSSTPDNGVDSADAESTPLGLQTFPEDHQSTRSIKTAFNRSSMEFKTEEAIQAKEEEGEEEITMPQCEWVPSSSDKLFQIVSDIEHASDFLQKISEKNYELNDDVDGVLTNFIGQMPEEELEMSIREWCYYNAKQAKDLLSISCESMLQVFKEESDRAMEFLKNLPVKNEE